MPAESLGPVVWLAQNNAGAAPGSGATPAAARPDRNVGERRGPARSTPTTAGCVASKGTRAPFGRGVNGACEGGVCSLRPSVCTAAGGSSVLRGRCAGSGASARRPIRRPVTVSRSPCCSPSPGSVRAGAAGRFGSRRRRTDVRGPVSRRHRRAAPTVALNARAARPGVPAQPAVVCCGEAAWDSKVGGVASRPCGENTLQTRMLRKAAAEHPHRPAA
jgi:hypothetical protein